MLADLAFAPIIKHIEPVFCCCSDIECEALNHNKGIMRQLETELRTAGELGQTLLARHDNYVKEVEEERRYFLAEIERQSSFAKLVDELELNNRELEHRNLCTMRDNALLLKRLEDLNASLNETEVQNHQLRTTLVETESEVGRLSHKTVKAKGLESQILTLELERSGLEKEMETLACSNNQNHSRYAQAKRQIVELQRQLEQIQSFETERLHDQLEFSVMTTLDVLEHGSVFDSHGSESSSTEEKELKEFVSELLSSNTALEKNSSEMRRILENSQDEIASLRQQLQQQQDQQTRDAIGEGNYGPRKTVSQELHQHHHYHYHVPTKALEKRSRGKTEGKLRSHSITLDAPDGGKSTHLTDRAPRVRQHNVPLNTSTPIRNIPSKEHVPSDPPPSSSRQLRDDSGYFSLASAHGRDRSESVVRHQSPCPVDSKQKPSSMMDLHGDMNPRQRSNSHESIFSSFQPFTCASVMNTPRTGPVLRRNSFESVHFNELGAGYSAAEEKAREHILRHSNSHESVLERVQRPSQAELLLTRLNNGSMRRPFPSPLQNVASEATVSVTSATAGSYKQHKSESQTPRGSSYSALRSAAAAQKVTSPGISSPTLGPTSAAFWKRSTEKSLPTIRRPDGPSRWTSFVRWNSHSTQSEGDTKGKGDGVRKVAHATMATSSSTAEAIERSLSTTRAGRAAGSAQLSSMEEDLLRDALG